MKPTAKQIAEVQETNKKAEVINDSARPSKIKSVASVNGSGLFDSDDDSEDIFAKKKPENKIKTAPTVNKDNTAKSKIATGSLFDDDNEEYGKCKSEVKLAVKYANKFDKTSQKFEFHSFLM